MKNKDEVHETIIEITNKTKEKPYIKKETHLHIKNPTGSNINNTVPEKEVKEGVINLTGTKLAENKTRVLNSGIKFVLEQFYATFFVELHIS